MIPDHNDITSHDSHVRTMADMHGCMNWLGTAFPQSCELRSELSTAVLCPMIFEPNISWARM